jgi:predicted AlkP superfamily phosphohydrolase/phosphomutase
MRRTVLIGLDGATHTVLEPLLAAGHMPFLNEFLLGGVRATLLSTPHALTPPAWTSMITGRTPGHHGIFDFIRAAETPDGFYFTLNMSHDVRCETLWSRASRQGRTVAFLNFPVSCPPEPINGYCVPGFVHWRHLRQSVHPRGFFDALNSIDGFDAKALSFDMNEELKSIQYLAPDEYEPWIRHNMRRERHLFRIVRHILTHDPTDLTAVIFDGVDKLQHLCWRFLDPQLVPSDPTPWERRIRTLCLEYFQQLDGFVSSIVNLAGDEAQVFVASDHGFGPTTDVFFANAWLAREGYLSWTVEAARSPVVSISADRIKNHVVGIDWRKTVAYALTPSSNGIYIRRSAGPGQPGVTGDRYEPFRRELIAKLLALTHPKTGGQLVHRALTREEAFPGEANAAAPDVTLIMADYSFLSVLPSDGIVQRRPEPWGTHYPEGVFIARGAGLEAGRAVAPLAIVDVAPTLLYSLGLPVDLEMEGRLPENIFRPDFLDAHPPAYEGQSRSARNTQDVTIDLSDAPSREAEAAVLDHLRALGYLAS